jgi:aromatic-L-amino-acid/L-tryptophan decarboxylase
MTPDEFRAHGYELIDWIATYLEAVDVDDGAPRPVAPSVEPGSIRGALAEHPPAQPEPWSHLFDDLERVIVPGIVHWQHPRFFAYFPANSSYSSILAELLTAGLGVNGMSWVTSPACTELET